jgi:flagellar basal-body rod protein FlgB
MTHLFESVSPLVAALDYHTERHNLIVSNIANVDTPGYRSREIEFVDELERLDAPLALTRSSHQHLRAFGASPDPRIRIFEETWATPGPDGNTVRLEHEMSRLQANSMRYRASTQMVAQHLGMLRYAIASRR